MSSFFKNWSIHQVKQHLLKLNLPNEFTIDNVLLKWNKEYSMYMTIASYYTKDLRNALSELVKDGVYKQEYTQIKRSSGSTTDIKYTKI